MNHQLLGQDQGFRFPMVVLQQVQDQFHPGELNKHEKYSFKLVFK